jgi:hypothetical protein
LFSHKKEKKEKKKKMTSPSSEFPPPQSGRIRARIDSSEAQPRPVNSASQQGPKISRARFKCPKCEKDYAHLKGLNRHITLHHEGVAPVKKHEASGFECLDEATKQRNAIIAAANARLAACDAELEQVESRRKLWEAFCPSYIAACLAPLQSSSLPRDCRDASTQIDAQNHRAAAFVEPSSQQQQPQQQQDENMMNSVFDSWDGAPDVEVSASTVQDDDEPRCCEEQNQQLQQNGLKEQFLRSSRDEHSSTSVAFACPAALSGQQMNQQPQQQQQRMSGSAIGVWCTPKAKQASLRKQTGEASPWSFAAATSGSDNWPTQLPRSAPRNFNQQARWPSFSAHEEHRGEFRQQQQQQEQHSSITRNAIDLVDEDKPPQAQQQQESMRCPSQASPRKVKALGIKNPNALY